MQRKFEAACEPKMTKEQLEERLKELQNNRSEMNKKRDNLEQRAKRLNKEIRKVILRHFRFQSIIYIKRRRKN